MTDFGAIKGWVDTQEKVVGKSHPEVRGSLDELEEDVLWVLLVLDTTLDAVLDAALDVRLDACRLDDIVDEFVNEELFSPPPQLVRRAAIDNRMKVFIFNK